MMNTGQASLRRSRLTLVLLMVLFGLPVVSAWWLFTHPQWQPGATTNLGQLISPVRPLAALPLHDLNGQTIQQGFLRQGWTLVYFAPPQCGERCTQAAYQMHQVRLAQGRNVGLVQRLMVVPETAPAQAYAAVRADYPHMTVARPQAGRATEVLEPFQLSAGEVVSDSGRIYLADPMGNLMMSYAAEQDPGDLIGDLEHLLKISPLRPTGAVQG